MNRVRAKDTEKVHGDHAPLKRGEAKVSDSISPVQGDKYSRCNSVAQVSVHSPRRLRGVGDVQWAEGIDVSTG